MPATAVTPQTPVSLIGTIAANAADLAETAADVTNGNSAVLTGREMLMVRNSHATNPYTCSITSVADKLGRLGHITSYSLAAGEIALFGPFPMEGWSSSGTLLFQGENAAIKFTVIRIPNF